MQIPPGMENRTPPHTPRDATCARARTPKPDGRRQRASDGLNQRTPLRLGRRPPLSAAAKCCTKRFASRNGRGCRRGHAGRGAEGPADASAQHRAMHQRRAEAGRRKLWRRHELREEALRGARACACMQRSSMGSRKSLPRPRRSRRARCARTAMQQWRRRQRRKLPVHSTSS